jgi:3-ketosteroid 9alpha-monooxygenase subunit B
VSVAAATGAGYHALRVSAVIDETPDAKSFVFEVPPALADTFRYRPGQFLTLRLPVAGRHVPRCYSMSSAPAVDSAPRVTVKRVLSGRGSNWLCDQVRVGDCLEVLAPAGVFTPPTLDGDFLLLGGGSGITPVFAILRSALLLGRGRIFLVYANRDERSVIFRDELKALAGAHPARLQVVHWLDSVQGMPSVAQLAELARPFRHAQAFICGPAPFMDATVAALQALEMAAEQIHVERFASLPDEEDTAALKTAAAAAAPVSAIEQANIEIMLDGQLHRITCQGQQTLLDAAFAAGLHLPHSCQAGLCASCMCQVQEGAVTLRHNEVLDKKDLAKSWTLACQAVPASALVRVKFPS